MKIEDSILLSLKKVLGDNSANEGFFDTDLIFFINSELATLAQVGVGPEAGFEITNEKDRWDDFIEDDLSLNFVKGYLAAKLRLQFDPPANSFLVDSLNKIANEYLWRIQVAADDYPATALQNESEVTDYDTGATHECGCQLSGT